MTEASMASKVVAWLREQHWDVFQEVKIHDGGGVADIVATHRTMEDRRRVWVIECKRSLTFDVIAQAMAWQPYAHWCSVAVPATEKRRLSRGRALARSVCRAHGVGLLEVTHHGVDTQISATVNRRSHPSTLLDRLCDEHRTYAKAGSASGDHWSPYKQTCLGLRQVVAANPGICLSDAVRRLREHHYASDSSARSALATWLERGTVPGVEMRRDGRRLTLFVREEATA